MPEDVAKSICSARSRSFSEIPPTVSVDVAAKSRTFRVNVPVGGSAADVHRALEASGAEVATGKYIVVHKGLAGRVQCYITSRYV